MHEHIGQNPEEVDALAAELDRRATEIVDLQQAITTRLQATVWTGPDRDRFEGDWSTTTAQSIAQVVDAIRSASEAAAADARDQRLVSDAA